MPMYDQTRVFKYIMCIINNKDYLFVEHNSMSIYLHYALVGVVMWLPLQSIRLVKYQVERENGLQIYNKYLLYDERS